MSPRSSTGCFRAAAAALAVALVTLGTATSVAGTASAAPPTTAPPIRQLHKAGTAAYTPTPAGSGALAPLSTEIPRTFEPEAERSKSNTPHRSLNPDRSFASRQGAAVKRVAGRAVASAARPAGQGAGRGRRAPRLLSSFDGINHRDHRTASGGNQFSVEPPDQGLCVGGGQVVEAVNSAFQVFHADGTGQTGVEALNQFFGYPPALVRPSGPFGPFVTDPSCLYDPTTRSFFLVALTLDVVPATGEFTGANHIDIAVARDPSSTWDIYRLDVTDDGTNGTPTHPHCPCLGDYPHIGVDAHGFYLTTNEYSFFGPEFNSAQVYAFSKRALARGDVNVGVTQFDTTGADRGLNGFTIWPAQSPAADQYSHEADGTAYFLSSNAAQEATGTSEYVSRSIVTWSLTNTESLNWARPRLQLHDTRVPVRTYSLPPLSNQKAGPVPLAECLNADPCATTVLDAPDPFKPEVESGLDSNDTRMQQVTYARGRLYGALDTAVTVSGAQKAGIAWYIVRPRSSSQTLRAHLTRQGQLGLTGNNLIYPAIGVNARGRGVMAFTLVGDQYHPSAAYAAFDGRTGAGNLFLAKAGLGPQDGFSGYKAFGRPPRPRWGDYGAAAVDGRNIWIASEYIGQTCTLVVYQSGELGSCNGTRTALANWDTRISRIRP
jgi:hypothetical protein